jgi:O-antigen/teichoic acid export membrane protein
MTAGLVERARGRLPAVAMPTLVSIAASGTSAATTFVVAREIGAASFGHFTVVLSIALIVTVGMAMSLNYVMYQELPRADPAQRPALVSTGLFATLLLGAGVVVAGLLASPLLTAAFGVDRRTLAFALALALSLTLNQLTDSFLRGLSRFAFVAALKLAVAVAYLGASAYALLVLQIRDAEFYLIALIVTNVVFAVVAGARSGIVPSSWSPPLARSLYRHGAIVSAIAALTAVLFGVDVVMLNHWATAADVGIYSVYNGFPKRLLGVVFVEGIGLALLPTMALMDKPALLRRIRRLVPAVFAATAVASFAASAVLFLLLRADYPYRLGLMALSAVGIGTHTVFNLYFFALSMDGVRGAKVFIAALLVGAVPALAGQALLISSYGTVGALVAFPLTNVLLVAVIVTAVHRVYP